MNETLLDVEGMSCASCVRHIQRALDVLEGVQQVEVRLREGQVRVQHGLHVVSDKLIEVLAAAGYPSQLHPEAVARPR
jgi:copper chaperone